MTTLSEEFQRLCNGHLNQDPIYTDIKRFYSGELLDSVCVERLVSDLFDRFEEVSFSFLLQSFSSILLIANLQDEQTKKNLKNAYKQILLAKPSRRNFFIHGLYHFIESYLDLPTTEFSLSDFTFRAVETSSEKMTTLSCLWILLGKLKGQHDRVQEGFILIESQKQLCDIRSRPFLSFGENDHSFDVEQKRLSFVMLFYLSSKIHPEEIEQFEENIKNVQKLTNPLLITLLKCIEKCSFDEKLSVSLIKSKWATFKKPQLSGLISFEGRQSPLGMFKFQQMDIPAFGPQSMPINETNGFGILSTSGCYRFDGKNHITGWIQWAYNQQWWQVEVDVQSDTIQIEISTKEEKLQKPFAFVFFVKAKQCLIQEDLILAPGSLEHYKGTNSQISFEKDHERISIQSLKDATTHVIPLAGEGCFWGGDFLLAYEVNSPKACFEIHQNFLNL